MNEEESLGRLSDTQRRVEELEFLSTSQQEEIVILKQDRDATRNRCILLEKKQALAGRFTIRQILTMLIGPGSIATVISSAVSYYVTSETRTIATSTETNKTEIAEVRMELRDVETELDKRNGFMQRTEADLREVKTRSERNEAAITAADKKADAAVTDRWRETDHRHYATKEQAKHDRHTEINDRQDGDLIDLRERISKMEGVDDGE